MLKYKVIWGTLLLILCVCGSAMAKNTHLVTVVKIIDGDSVLVSDGSKKIEVRLWGIDTPEYRQPYSKAAKKFTKKLLENKTVHMEVKDKDKYGRMVALLTMDNGISANEMLVKKGFAWVHIYYCKEAVCEKWKKYQKEARKRRLGLWREHEPVAPWVWKRSHKRF